MAFSKKTWVNRLVEFPSRRIITSMGGSLESSMIIDVERDEGEIFQEGDELSAENMNKFEQRIADEFSHVETEISETKKSVSDGKGLIAAAITAKKVAASASDSFAVLAQKIRSIISGSGNAVRADVLEGKTFTNDDGVEYTGTMATMNGGTYAPSGSQQTIPCSGKKMNSNIVISGVENLIGENIKKGEVVGGVTGTYCGGIILNSPMSQRDLSLSGTTARSVAVVGTVGYTITALFVRIQFGTMWSPLIYVEGKTTLSYTSYSVYDGGKYGYLQMCFNKSEMKLYAKLPNTDLVTKAIISVYKTYSIQN